MTSFLFWRGLREDAWKIFVGLMVLAPVYIALFLPRTSVASRWAAGFMGVAVGIMISVDMIARERANGSWDFLRSCPVSLRAIISGRVLSALAILAIAIFSALALNALFLTAAPDWMRTRIELLYGIPDLWPSMRTLFAYSFLPAVLGLFLGFMASCQGGNEHKALLLGVIAFFAIVISVQLCEMLMDVLENAYGRKFWYPQPLYDSLVTGTFFFFLEALLAGITVLFGIAAFRRRLINQ